MTKGGRIPRSRRAENDARAAEAMKGQFGEGADQCTRGRPHTGGQAVRSPARNLRYLRFLLFNASKVLRCHFHKCLWRGEADLDQRVWLLRVHDYGLGRLHIHELVFDLLHRIQAKLLRFFRPFFSPQSAQRSRRKEERPQIVTELIQ